jgi:SOS response regulatory protein OraA/RecX
VDGTLARLTEAGLIDDRRAGAAHVRTASRVKGRGRLRIERELVARGLDRTLAHDLAAEVPQEDELREVRRIISRKRLPARPTPADRRRVVQHLLRRGFSSEVIRKAMGRDDDE